MAFTQLMKPDNYSVSGNRWRYIHYDNGDEELYDIKRDPYEWNNLATDPANSKHIARLKQHVPKTFAKFIPAQAKELVKLKWHPVEAGPIPSSKPDGNKIDVNFSNQRGQPVNIYRMKPDGESQSFGTLETGWFKPYPTRPGDVWKATDKKKESSTWIFCRW